MNGWKLLAPLAIALLTPAAAQSERLFLAGAELADTAYYGYAGLVLPGPGGSGERGWLQRYWIDAFGYEYDAGPGRVEAEAYGLEASLGYGSSSERGWASAWVGLRYTDTDLSPDDPTATARGSQTGFKFQLDGERLAEAAARLDAGHDPSAAPAHRRARLDLAANHGREPRPTCARVMAREESHFRRQLNARTPP